MTVETLSSNVVNYLVWRYLQEAGYGRAAIYLSQEWIRDPQTLPFATNVHRNALVEMLQDGMQLDRLKAKATQTDLRYRFGADHGPRYSAQISGGPVRLPTKDDTGGPEANYHSHDANSRKVDRRKKKINGSERVNGDAMEIEANGIHAPSRGESEAVVSDAESPIIEEIPLPKTLVNGRSLAVETVLGDVPKEDFRLFARIEVDKPITSVKHMLWSRNDQSENLLLVAGKSFVRLHVIPRSRDSTTHSRDLTLPYDQLDITALAWKEDNEMLLATEQENTNEHGESMFKYALNTSYGDGFREISQSTAILSPVLQAKWNSDGQYLLTVAATDKTGSIRIWKKTASDLIVYSTDSPVFDCQWMSETQFVVCGLRFLKIFDFDYDAREIKPSKDVKTETEWDKVVFDPFNNTLCCRSVDGDTLGLVHLPDDTLQTFAVEDGPITDMAFQPVHNRTSYNEDSPQILATSSHFGYVQVWDVRKGLSPMGHRIVLWSRPALSLAFSPDGSLLAAAGYDCCLIWNPEKGPNYYPRGRWLATKEENWVIPASNDDAEDAPLQKVEWSVDCKQVAFAYGNQVAIINADFPQG